MGLRHEEISSDCDPQRPAGFESALGLHQKKEFKNPQAAQSVYDDFVKTRKALSLTAESIQEPSSEILKQRGLKRINFRNHGYFVLFCMLDGVVRITNIFHDLEDFERKLDG